MTQPRPLSSEQEHLFRTLGPEITMTELRRKVHLSIPRIKQEAARLGVALLDPAVSHQRARSAAAERAQRLSEDQIALIRTLGPNIPLSALMRATHMSSASLKKHAARLDVSLLPYEIARKEAAAKALRKLTPEQEAIIRTKGHCTSTHALSRETGLSRRIVIREAARLGVTLQSPEASRRQRDARAQDAEYRQRRRATMSAQIDRLMMEPAALSVLHDMLLNRAPRGRIAAKIGINRQTLGRWMTDRVLDWVTAQLQAQSGNIPSTCTSITKAAA